MLERSWPWLVSVAAPALAAFCLFLWVAIAPQVWESSAEVGYAARPLAQAMARDTTATQTDVAAATDTDRLRIGVRDTWRTDSEAAEEYLLEGFYLRDRDRSGKLDRAEFVSGASQELSGRQTEFFVAADRNSDGLLAALEYREALLAWSVAVHACEGRDE
jgi:hypothetical protein